MLSRRSLLWGSLVAKAISAETGELRLLVVTGGHAFQEEPFLEMFRAMKGVRFRHVRFGVDAEQMLNPDAARDFDAMVFYDMHPNPEPHWNAWMKLLAHGMPSVFLHHALGSYPKQAQYLDIIGGRARFTKAIIPGEISTFWKHDEEMRVKIADRAHPITQGIDDFTILDECYKGYYVRPDAHILLTTDHPLSEPKLGWTYRYGNSPIVYLQLGHDRFAYENPAFRTLLARSIRWVAGKL